MILPLEISFGAFGVPLPYQSGVMLIKPGLLWLRAREAGVRAAPLRQPIHLAAVFNGSLTLSEIANSTLWSLPAIFSTLRR
jgi:hypothetical protein